MLIVNGDHPDVSSLDRSFYHEDDLFGDDQEENHAEDPSDYTPDAYRNGTASEEEGEMYAEHDEDGDWDEPA